MNAILWLFQGVLAFTFLIAGTLKVARPKQKVTAIPAMRWATRLSPIQIKLIGVAEIIGSLGLVEPWATGILPVLTPIAAGCFALLMVGAVLVQARTREAQMLPLALAVMSTIVAVARAGAL